MAATTHVPFEQIDDESIELALATGPMAVLRYLRAAHQYLAAAKGRVINLRSGSEIQGLNGYGSYIAAKAAIGGITRAAAREWGPKASRSTPSARSRSVKRHWRTLTNDLKISSSRYRRCRSSDPEHDIGRLGVFLAGPDASYITGCTISADGRGCFVG